MPKGHTNNPHGRKKGVPNKATTELRTMLISAFECEMHEMETLIADNLVKIYEAEHPGDGA